MAPLEQQLPELPLPPPDGEGNSMAALEAAGFANKNLERMAAEADHNRSELAKTHIVRAGLTVFWVMIGLFVFGALTLAWHFLAPSGWCWLAADQIAQLKALIAGVVLSSGAQALSKKYVT